MRDEVMGCSLGGSGISITCSSRVRVAFRKGMCVGVRVAVQPLYATIDSFASADMTILKTPRMSKGSRRQTRGASADGAGGNGRRAILTEGEGGGVTASKGRHSSKQRASQGFDPGV